jgi:hypothetical protein
MRFSCVSAAITATTHGASSPHCPGSHSWLNSLTPVSAPVQRGVGKRGHRIFMARFDCQRYGSLLISSVILVHLPCRNSFLYIVSLSRCRLCDATTGTPHGTSFAYWRTGCRQLRDLVRRTLLLYLACLATYISTYCFRTVSALERVLRYTSYLHPCCLESTVNIVFAVSPSSCNVGGEGQNDASVKC